MAILVTLSPDDLSWAARIGARRLTTATGSPRWAYRDGRSGLDTHRIGAEAELAFCLALGYRWPARVGNYKGADVDPDWEVRWSSGSRLKVTPNDDPTRRVALVTGTTPHYAVIGYIRAGLAQHDVPLTDPGERGWPAHFIPAAALTPFVEADMLAGIL